MEIAVSSATTSVCCRKQVRATSMRNWPANAGDVNVCVVRYMAITTSYTTLHCHSAVPFDVLGSGSRKLIQRILLYHLLVRAISRIDYVTVNCTCDSPSRIISNYVDASRSNSDTRVD